jgi:hypothetical protein
MENPKKMTREEEAEEIIRRLQKTNEERDIEARKLEMEQLMVLFSKMIAEEIDKESLERLKRQIDNSQDPC